MGWGLDSPGNQPIGEMFVGPRNRCRTKCVNHNGRNAIALWGRQLEPVCLECLEGAAKEYKKQRKKKL